MIELRPDKPYRGHDHNGNPVERSRHFVQDKSGWWHIVPVGLRGAACGGTPRQAHALALPGDARICHGCVDAAGSLLIGYVRRCVECKEPLPPEIPANMWVCLACHDSRESRRVVYQTSGGRSHQGATTRRLHWGGHWGGRR